MRLPRNRLVARKRDGRYAVRLSDDVRQLLDQLLGELRELLEGDLPAGDARLERLFPPAYLTDPDANAEYQRFMRSELLTSRLSAIDQMRETIGATELTEAQLMAWMTTVNSVRLVLGTMLDVSEDDTLEGLTPEDPSFGAYLLYGELSVILEHIVAALGE
jgi:Domain of unknown function (DUF2017)